MINKRKIDYSIDRNFSIDSDDCIFPDNCIRLFKYPGKANKYNIAMSIADVPALFEKNTILTNKDLMKRSFIKIKKQTSFIEGEKRNAITFSIDVIPKNFGAKIEKLKIIKNKVINIKKMTYDEATQAIANKGSEFHNKLSMFYSIVLKLRELRKQKQISKRFIKNHLSELITYELYIAFSSIITKRYAKKFSFTLNNNSLIKFSAPLRNPMDFKNLEIIRNNII